MPSLLGDNMSAPEVARTQITYGHVGWLIYLGDEDVKEALDGTYGIHYGTEHEMDGQTLYCLQIDPRYTIADVTAYINELGGSAYTPPE